MSKNDLRELVEAVDEDEVGLSVICQSFNRVIGKGQAEYYHGGGMPGSIIQRQWDRVWQEG